MALQHLIRLLIMTHKPPVTEYRDLQAVLHIAMKAFETYDVDPDDPASLAEARRLWNAAMDANGDLISASAPRRSAIVKLDI
jgi:hypothetical protein